MTDWPTGRIPDDISTGYGIPELYSARAIDAVTANLVCVGAVNTTWKAELKLGSKVWIPVLDSATTHTVDPSGEWGGSRAHVNTDFFATAASITADQWKECPFQLSDGDNLQTQVKDLLERMAKRAGYEIAEDIDTEVNTQFQSLTDTWAGSDGQTFSDDILLDLMEGLDEADVPRENRSLVGDPSLRADCFKIDKFVHRDYNMTLTGELGKTPYGDKILITNNLSQASTGAYGAYLHEDAIGCVIQMPIQVKHYRDEPHASDMVVARAIFGADVIRATFGAEFYTRKM